MGGMGVSYQLNLGVWIVLKRVFVLAFPYEFLFSEIFC